MEDPPACGPREFETTHWSLVAAAKTETDHARAREALEELCRLYWYPLYAFVRHRGHSSGEADQCDEDRDRRPHHSPPQWIPSTRVPWL